MVGGPETGPEEERPLDDVHARFGYLPLEPRESARRLLAKRVQFRSRRDVRTELGDLLADRLEIRSRCHIRADTGDLLPYRARFLSDPQLEPVIGHSERLSRSH